MESDKIKMEVNIAGEHIALNVQFSQQEAVRKTEAELRLLHREWSERMPGKSPKELLAMMAYRYASRYYELLEKTEREIEDADALLEYARHLCGPDESSHEADITIS